MTLEADVARTIRTYLEGIGLRVLRADPGGRTWRSRPGSRGMPDFYGILPNGRWWCVEVKAPDARRRNDQPAQSELLRYLTANGALMILATSVQDVHERLNPRVIAEHRAWSATPYQQPVGV
jgi:hypothetical protein